MNAPPQAQNPIAALRRFARKQSDAERCELCSKELGPQHQHLLEPANRRLVCSCDACAILFSGQQGGRYRRVPRRIELLADFKMTDAQWDDLHLPINLAFFYRNSAAQKVIAMFPSPAGATESLLTLESWQDLAAENPVLNELEPDVEALLVNRVGPLREYSRVPIDECFKLVGLIRTHWRGLSGGTEVWKEIAKFSASLKERAVSTGGASA
jgi:Family of unknown function (DUF5947)